MLSDFIFDEHDIPKLATHLWDTIGAQRDEDVYVLLAFDDEKKLLAQHILAVGETLLGGDDASVIILDFLKAHESKNLVVAVTIPNLNPEDGPSKRHFDFAELMQGLSQHNKENYRFQFRGMILAGPDGGGFLSRQSSMSRGLDKNEQLIEMLEQIATGLPTSHFLHGPLGQFVQDVKASYAAEQVKQGKRDATPPPGLSPEDFGSKPINMMELPPLRPRDDDDKGLVN